MEVRNYYQHPAVRARITEFLGGFSLDQATAYYITRCIEPIYDDYVVKPPAELNEYLDRGYDLHRSLWDRESLVVHLDIEYNNTDFPAEPYLDPARTFLIQQPVEWAIEKLLLEYGIRPLHLLTGRGHHFLWTLRRAHPGFYLLRQIDKVSRALQGKYQQPMAPTGEAVTLDVGAAFSGLSMVVEYLGHRILMGSRPHMEIPVEFMDISVSPQQRGREMVSVDLTEYGDPLYTRMIRVPYSVYLKPYQKYGVIHERIRDLVSILFVLPLHEMDVVQAVKIMRDPKKVAAVAERASAVIPDQSDGTERMIRDYLGSRLARFHRGYYSDEHDPPEAWPRTYDRTPLERVPPCIRQYLVHPNDLLLKPDAIRQVVRVFLALGWRCRHIAGLIRSKYERDYHWGRRWDIYEASTRADFYVRCFAGLIDSGLDNLADFTCTTTRENHLCFNPDGSCSLDFFRTLLQERQQPCLVGR